MHKTCEAFTLRNFLRTNNTVSPNHPAFQVTDSSLTVGAGVSLSVLIAQLQANQSKSGSFEHLANHLLKIANVPVRNIGSWAGNLMLTHNHDNFPSDVFTMMAGAGATLTLGAMCLILNFMPHSFSLLTN